MDNICVIGIAGGSASGKTTIVKRLKESFGQDICLINHDAYYRSYEEMPIEERIKMNYDHPSAFDTEMMVKDIKLLSQGKCIHMPIYDYTNYIRCHDTELVEPKKVIIVEGILILEDKSLRDLMDLKVFVDTDADERLMRRIIRDTKKRGRSIESIISQYRSTVKPMHEQFVEPSKKYADIVVPRGGKNKAAMSILKEHLKTLINT